MIKPDDIGVKTCAKINEYGKESELWYDCPACGTELEVSNDGSEPSGIPSFPWDHKNWKRWDAA